MQKLEYIYEHFQENEKIHESNPDITSQEYDTNIYPHINNDIEYSLFENIVDSYYLDS